MDVLRSIVPYMAPVVIGAVIAVLAPVFQTSRRLREDLAQESAMLDRLPRAARTEMRAEVNRRALRLVSLTRYPPVTRIEILTLALLISLLAFSVATGVENLRFGDVGPIEYIGSAVFLIGAQVGAHAAFYLPWSSRAVHRLQFADRHLGETEAAVLARMLRVGDTLADAMTKVVMSAAFGFQIGVSVWRLTIGHSEYPIGAGLLAGTGLGALALMFLAMLRPAAGHDLSFELLKRLQPEEMSAFERAVQDTIARRSARELKRKRRSAAGPKPAQGERVALTE